MWDSIASLFSSSGSAANAASAANGAMGAGHLASLGAQTANTIDMTQKLANIGSLVGGLGSAYGSVMGANLQNGYAKKMLNLQEDNIAYQKDKEKKKQASFDLAAANAFAPTPTVAPKLNLGA